MCEFFDETSHSHQSTPLSSNHVAKWRAGLQYHIEHGKVKSADLFDVLVVICPCGTDKRVRPSHQSWCD